MQVNQAIIIVNPTSSVKYLAQRIMEGGYLVLAIFTEFPYEDLSYFQREPELFNQVFSMAKLDFNTIAEIIKDNNVCYVINGSEFSTHITDLINAKFFPQFANDPSTSQLRANKFLQQEALKTAGMPHIRQQKITAPFIAEKLSIDSFPVFAKPNLGLASIGAFKAENKSQLISQLDALTLSDRSAEYIVQELIQGTEYIVDTFSNQGNHHVSCIVRVHKSEYRDSKLYRFCEVVEDNNLWNKCEQFIFQALDTTGFKNGFAHSEIFVLADGSLRLIEINPRISGAKGYVNKLAAQSGLNTQEGLLLNMLKGKSLVSSKANDIKQQAMLLNLYKMHPGKINLSHTKLENKLVKEYDLLIPEGEYNSAIKFDVTDIVLLVLISSDSKTELNEYTKQLFNLEASGELI